MKKNRILLFAPNMIGVRGGVHRVQPGHGIGSIAGNLRDLGHEVIIRDTALEGYNNVEDTEFKDLVMIGESYDSIKKFIEDVRPDWVLVSILFSNLVVHGKKIAEIVKSIDPKIKTILGGNHVNNTYTEVLNDRFVDYVVLGECDFSVGELISSVMEGKDIGKIQGVAFKYDNKIISNGLSPRINDLNTLPREARDLMNMEGYFDVGLFHSAKSRSKRVGNIMATRGCPEKCSFCTTPQMWGNTVRWRDPEHIFAEIRDIVTDYGIEEIQFDDDTLTANIKKLLMLCDLMEPLNIKWCTPNGVKINYHSKNPTKQDNLYKRMFESGCYQITFGVETGNQDILDNTINKRLPLDTVKPAIESAKKAGMLVHTFWMVGFPWRNL